jgi:hypothetical protein
MISIIIFFSIIIFNTILIIILREKIKRIYLPKWLVITALFTTSIGLVFVLWQNSEINIELSKRSWISIEGKIIESNIIGKRALRTEVKYQYKINDEIYYGYSDYNIPGFGSKNYRRKTARIVRNDNPVGANVKVYYDPINPEKSTLRYGPYWSNYMIIGFGSVLMMLGMFILKWKLITRNIK